MPMPVSNYSLAREASARAKKCLPPMIAHVVCDRIEDATINSWLGEGNQWKALVEEINELPEPSEEKP